MTVEEGDRLTLETPAGGGWGPAYATPAAPTRMDRLSL